MLKKHSIWIGGGDRRCCRYNIHHNSTFLLYIFLFIVVSSLFTNSSDNIFTLAHKHTHTQCYCLLMSNVDQIQIIINNFVQFVFVCVIPTCFHRTQLSTPFGMAIFRHFATLICYGSACTIVQYCTIHLVTMFTISPCLIICRALFFRIL